MACLSHAIVPVMSVGPATLCLTVIDPSRSVVIVAVFQSSEDTSQRTNVAWVIPRYPCEGACLSYSGSWDKRCPLGQKSEGLLAAWRFPGVQARQHDRAHAISTTERDSSFVFPRKKCHQHSDRRNPSAFFSFGCSSLSRVYVSAPVIVVIAVTTLVSPLRKATPSGWDALGSSRSRWTR